MKKKKAGIERPYTLHEFAWKVEELAKDANIEYFDRLDYFSGGSLDDDKKMLTDSIDVISITDFGSSEGIYSGFYLRGGYFEGNVRFAMAKTLEQSKEDYVRMSVMAAKICLLARDYIYDNQEEFNWSGFNLYEDDCSDVKKWFLWSENKERALANLAEQKKAHPERKYFYRDNYTREMFEYKTE